ncbi:hypothetical protein [Actinomadura sp. BRA 177]|uniref:hypothetical protein n=1 Tax=Actinomadura sp. BRA 177 TaxID=2745202 RepID=UPI0015953644|nr:hypothetical protein [Actinomadura sp. BRA 177]NVI90348.1 hypothetical protein [Actinomadura sp. BRA 177]
MNAIYAESVQDHEFADETLRLMNVMQRRNCNAHPAQYWQFSEYGAGYPIDRQAQWTRRRRSRLGDTRGRTGGPMRSGEEPEETKSLQ